MGSEYNEKFRISYFGTDNELKLTPTMLTVFLQDIAIAHSNSIGYTLDYLAEVMRGWAITDWHIKVKRFPKYGEEISITTWSNFNRKIQAQRFYKIEDSSGDVIAVVASRWIFMDLIRRRPLNITEEMECAYACNIPSPIEDEKYKMPKFNQDSDYTQREFIVTRRDTDTNGHTNNTKYIEWAMDDVPDEIYDDFDVEDLKVVYKKECYKNSKVRSKCFVMDIEDCKKLVISIFTDSTDESITYAQVVSTWHKK